MKYVLIHCLEAVRSEDGRVHAWIPRRLDKGVVKRQPIGRLRDRAVLMAPATPTLDSAEEHGDGLTVEGSRGRRALIRARSASPPSTVRHQGPLLQAALVGKIRGTAPCMTKSLGVERRHREIVLLIPYEMRPR